MPDHFYTTDRDGEVGPINGYEPEGITGYVYTAPQPDTAPVLRFWHEGRRDHYYTTESTGGMALYAGYKLEMLAFFINNTQKPNTTPLYRWYNDQDHFYTTDANGEIAAKSGYRFEGVTGYICTSQQPNTVPLYRWHYRPRYELVNGVHLKTWVYHKEAHEMRESILSLVRCVNYSPGKLRIITEPLDFRTPDSDHMGENPIDRTLYSGGYETYLSYEGEPHGPRFHVRRGGSESNIDLGPHLRRTADGHINFVHPFYRQRDAGPIWQQVLGDTAEVIKRGIDNAGKSEYERAIQDAVDIFQQWLDEKTKGDPKDEGDIRPGVREWLRDVYYYDDHFIRRGS